MSTILKKTVFRTGIKLVNINLALQEKIFLSVHSRKGNERRFQSFSVPAVHFPTLLVQFLNTLELESVDQNALQQDIMKLTFQDAECFSNPCTFTACFSTLTLAIHTQNTSLDKTLTSKTFFLLDTAAHSHSLKAYK